MVAVSDGAEPGAGLADGLAAGPDGEGAGADALGTGPEAEDEERTAEGLLLQEAASSAIVRAPTARRARRAQALSVGI